MNEPQEHTWHTPSIWGVILSDWYNCGARVTLTLRSGQQFTGTIRDHPAGTHDFVALQYLSSGREVRHDVQLSEIAAITAEAR